MQVRSEILEPGIAAHGGRIVKHTGDGFIATFDGARDATECALALQQAVSERTIEQPVEQRISFRMGVNVADVIIESDDIYGDGVNVAARLQSYAEPGGVVVSGTVAEQMGSHPGVDVIDLGDIYLRNLARPVRAFALYVQAAPARLVGDPVVGSEPRPSIAVLPFRMRPTDPDEKYFADGIVDDIIHGLAALKELFVISRGSAVRYGGATLDVRAIGRELGVRYLLYGSVRRAGGRLRIDTVLSGRGNGYRHSLGRVRGRTNRPVRASGSHRDERRPRDRAAGARARARSRDAESRPAEPDRVRLRAPGARLPVSRGL